MTLAKELCRILDLPEDLVWGEAQSKLTECIMYVNGELAYVNSITQNCITITTKNQKTLEVASNKVTSLELFLPSTGIYNTPTHGPIYVQKIPARQWRRSYNAGLYKATVFGGKTLGNYPWFVFEIDPTTRADFFKTKDKVVYYHRRKVGYEADGEFVCTFPAIKYELTKWLSSQSK